jgi:hypothetical protein
LIRRDPIVDGAARGLEGLGNMNVFGHSVADAAVVHLMQFQV